MVQCTFAAKSANNVGSKSPTMEELPLKLEDSLAARRKKESMRLIAISLCIVSVIINLVLSVLGFFFASVRHSPATFAFAADCVLDLISSSIVIWRYFGSPYTPYSSSRESKACISLGALFIIAGLGVIIEGIVFIFLKDTPKWFSVLIILAGVGFLACFLLGAAKLLLYYKIKSKSLFLDAVNSMLSALFAVVIIISDLVYSYDENVWYLDPVLSIIFSLGLLAYGFHIILTHFKGGDCQSEF